MKVVPAHTLHQWDIWCWLACYLGLLKSGTVLETKASSQFHILATWSFWGFFSRKSIVHFIFLKWHSQITQWCINRYQGIAMFYLLLFSPTSKKVLCGALGRDEQYSILVLHCVVKLNWGIEERSDILLDQYVHVCEKK